VVGEVVTEWLIGPHPVDSDLVGTFVVKPGRSLAWLTARHPSVTYFIREAQ
jgi:hypothetical protein